MLFCRRTRHHIQKLSHITDFIAAQLQHLPLVGLSQINRPKSLTVINDRTLQRQIGTVDTFKNARLTGAGTPHYTDKFTLMQRETDIAAALDSFAQIMQIKIFRQPFNGKYLHNSS